MPWLFSCFKKLREPVCGLTHLAGFFLSVAGLVYFAYHGAFKSHHLAAFSVFSASLIFLYGTSALYHLLPASERGLVILRRLDHIMIFVLIAGTYTPICLIPLRGWWGWSLLAAVWAVAGAGIIGKLCWFNAPRRLYTGIYLAMGWMVVIAVYPLANALPTAGLLWLLSGGLFYTVGAIIYACKYPDMVPGVFGFHELWHIFVMAGSFCHWWVMMQYLTPMN